MLCRGLRMSLTALSWCCSLDLFEVLRITALSEGRNNGAGRIEKKLIFAKNGNMKLQISRIGLLRKRISIFLAMKSTLTFPSFRPKPRLGSSPLTSSERKQILTARW